MGSCKLAKGKKMQAADVAEAGYKALKSGKIISAPGRNTSRIPIYSRNKP
jgi:hypothetical protein